MEGENNIRRDVCTPDTGDHAPIPRAPNPSADPGVLPRIAGLSVEEQKAPVDGDFDVATLEPVIALRLLSRGIQALADMTGDLPPTPPVSRPRTPSTKELRQELTTRPRTPSRPATPVPTDDLREASLDKGVIGDAEAHFAEPTGFDLVQPASPMEQYGAIARRFFSKKPPPISINDYLLRLHRYCPMSTAVYLAAGAYIQKLAVVDKTVPVTVRTVHRLLLASLRVAMKALEDLSYPHQRFAGVGGVTERELAKMEVSFCYLTDFNLRVDNVQLHDRMMMLQQLASSGSRISASHMKLKLPPRRQQDRRQTIL
ncbi:MAG: hypothetical protein M1828_004725 [Chrysothrix sp. TS-e1954]|nr:MAG: hypothetical protein M1828_004725 [Chrysothrix sp. TS-e1954]